MKHTVHYQEIPGEYPRILKNEPKVTPGTLREAIGRAKSLGSKFEIVAPEDPEDKDWTVIQADFGVWADLKAERTLEGVKALREHFQEQTSTSLKTN